MDRTLPVASTDSRVFELCTRSCSAGTGARMMCNISTFHAVCLLQCHRLPTSCWVFSACALVTFTGLAPLTTVDFHRGLRWCWWPAPRRWGGPPGGLCPCCQWTDENGAASCAYILLQITVASIMGDFTERGWHLGLHQRDVVFLVDVVSMSFR